MEKLTNLTLQEKVNKLETVINAKNIPAVDKQILFRDLESLKQILAEKSAK